MSSFLLWGLALVMLALGAAALVPRFLARVYGAVVILFVLLGIFLFCISPLLLIQLAHILTK